jgi:hypothetical protein
VARPRLEVADVLRAHGAAWRKANAGHVSLAQLKAMSAIETCRTASLGGHFERREDCAHMRVAYNSCRNRDCPKCQASAARRWLEDREAELLPVPSFHVVLTLPAAIGAIAFQNKAAVYDLLFRTAAETLTTIAADPKRLGARIGLTAVTHTWGSAMTHHPHVHVIVPGGDLSPDGSRWIACKPGFFLPVRVLLSTLLLAAIPTPSRPGRLRGIRGVAREERTSNPNNVLAGLVERVHRRRRADPDPVSVVGRCHDLRRRVNHRIRRMDQRSRPRSAVQGGGFSRPRRARVAVSLGQRTAAIAHRQHHNYGN